MLHSNYLSKAIMDDIKQRITKAYEALQQRTQNAITYSGKKYVDVIRESSKIASTIKKVSAFENHLTNDTKFQGNCETLALMAFEKVKDHLVERVLVNAFVIYTTLYFQDQSLNMSYQFMEFLMKYPVTITDEKAANEFIYMYQEQILNKKYSPDAMTSIIVKA